MFFLGLSCWTRQAHARYSFATRTMFHSRFFYALPVAKSATTLAGCHYEFTRAVFRRCASRARTTTTLAPPLTNLAAQAAVGKPRSLARRRARKHGRGGFVKVSAKPVWGFYARASPQLGPQRIVASAVEVPELQPFKPTAKAYAFARIATIVLLATCSCGSQCPSALLALTAAGAAQTAAAAPVPRGGANDDGDGAAVVEAAPRDVVEAPEEDRDEVYLDVHRPAKALARRRDLRRPWPRSSAAAARARAARERAPTRCRPSAACPARSRRRRARPGGRRDRPAALVVAAPPASAAAEELAAAVAPAATPSCSTRRARRRPTRAAGSRRRRCPRRCRRTRRSARSRCRRAPASCATWPSTAARARELARARARRRRTTSPRSSGRPRSTGSRRAEASSQRPRAATGSPRRGGGSTPPAAAAAAAEAGGARRRAPRAADATGGARKARRPSPRARRPGEAALPRRLDRDRVHRRAGGASSTGRRARRPGGATCARPRHRVVLDDRTSLLGDVLGARALLECVAR